MSTVQNGQHRRVARDSPNRLADNEFVERRNYLIDEDLHAGYQIPAILTGIILFGLLSMVLSVLAILLTGSQ